jgi:aspartyl-tRNA(Asn)/glutamyl-tRNA(Gln) amidotransferase subunit B
MEMAIAAEIQRQIDFYTLHPEKKMESGTYRFDLESQKTILMRKKEQADDYRYFPEPDLLPLLISEQYIEEIRKTLPEMPGERRKRYLCELKLASHTVETLIQDKPLCDYFEQASCSCENPVLLSNWILVEFVGRLKEKNKTLQTSGLVPQHIADLVNMIHKGTITGKIAKNIADDMVEAPNLHPQKIYDQNPLYHPLSDRASIEALIDDVLQKNPESVNDYKAGKTRAYGFLVGQVMKCSHGTACPSLVNELLTKKLT